MPQIFQVLRCYKCLIFQVHLAKKSNKFECKLCGEKQSIKRRYGIGTAKDCRMHVQKLNGIRGEIDEFKEIADTDDDCDETDVEIKVKNRKPKKSKWSDFVIDKQETNETAVQQSMYLNDTEVVLDVPKKRKINFKCPSRKTPKAGFDVNDPLPYNKQASYKNENDEASKSTIQKTEKKIAVTNLTTQNIIKTLNEKLQLKNDCTLALTMNTEQTINVSKTKQFVSPKISTNSKWAQFIEDGDCLESGTNYKNCGNDEPETTSILRNLGSSHELFALCDDNDLDDVLDI